jgi:hypothetical protein
VGTQTSRSPRLARLNGLMDKRIAKAREVVPEARDAARTCKPQRSTLPDLSSCFCGVGSRHAGIWRSVHFYRELCRFATRCSRLLAHTWLT